MNIKATLQKLNNFIVDSKTKENKELIQQIEGYSSSEQKQKVCNLLLENIKPIIGSCHIGPDVYRDVEFFTNINDEYMKTKTVFDMIDNSLLEGTKHVSKMILANPSNSIAILNKRKAILKTLENKMSTSTSTIDQFETLKELEKDVHWIFEDLDQNMEDLYNIVYFRMSLLKGLNNNGQVLSAYNVYRILLSPMIGIMSPIVYFIIPYLIIIYKFKIKISLKSYLKLIFATMMSGSHMFFSGTGSSKYFKTISYAFSMFFYFQGIFNSVEISRSLYKISKLLVNRMNNVVKFLKTSISILQELWIPDIMYNFLLSNDSENFLALDKQYKYVNDLKDIGFSLLTDFGTQLKQYKFFDKDISKNIISKVYIVDALISFIKFKNNNNLVYTEYTNTNDLNRPVFKMNNAWHPCLDKTKAICNDFGVGGDICNNAIITGPNAGGKSTFVKTLLINILLSQTCTISASSNCTMTPFYYINSQISIPDCKGYESLFQAELYRCKNNMDIIKSLGSDQYAFVVMDEIFNSTNVIEGISGAYAIAKKMGENNNSVIIFTTHFSYLTKLEKKTKNFINYRMNVEIDGDNINFPYKLSRGISKQYIALELLKQKGFDQDIIDEAILIKNKFL